MGILYLRSLEVIRLSIITSNYTAYDTGAMSADKLHACCWQWCWSTFIIPAAVDEESYVPLQTLSGGLSYTDNANSGISLRQVAQGSTQRGTCVRHARRQHQCYFL